MTSAVSRDLNVLYAEDNAGDARLAEETLKDSMYNVNLSVVEDGSSPWPTSARKETIRE